jgi:hypothetical protein
MAQIYLLSVLTLLLGGALAAAPAIGERFAALAGLADLAEQRSVGMGVGIAAAAVGAIKLFVRAPFDGVPVAGDLLPALVGILLGVTLILSVREPATPTDEFDKRSALDILVGYRTLIGYGAIAVSIAHFLFPAAVIL